ncbi:hypothetical protein MP638_005151 [Amoeboaphelidium occidentale]|nr:hypothetical protein MP638_005151 [Amoeboaphelidium occidentale]
MNSLNRLFSTLAQKPSSKRTKSSHQIYPSLPSAFNNQLKRMMNGRRKDRLKLHLNSTQNGIYKQNDILSKRERHFRRVVRAADSCAILRNPDLNEMVIPHWVNQSHQNNGNGSSVKLPFRRDLVGLSSRITQSLHESKDQMQLLNASLPFRRELVGLSSRITQSLHESKDQMQLLNASVLQEKDLQQGRDIMQSAECKLPLFDEVMKQCDDEQLPLNVQNAKDELKFRKERLVKEFQQHEDDNGTIGVQAAVLTLRIRNMILHLFHHQQDTKTRVLCDELIQRRRKKMDYLRRVDFQKYMELCRNLGLKYA